MKFKIKVSLLFFLFSCFYATSATIDTLRVFSRSMLKTIPNIVIKPNNYSTNQIKFPVLYLLHGAGDDYLGWLQIAPELTKYADQYKIIIVCPDGGGTSWYFDSPIDKSIRYETYTTGELINAVDQKYKTRANKKVTTL